MINFIYIGQDSNLKNRLNILLQYRISFPSSFDEALRLCIDLEKNLGGILFFEKNSLKKDISQITQIRKKNPHIYIILFTEELTLEEKKSYFKSGINDTADFNTDTERLLAGLEFIQKRHHQFFSSTDSHSEITHFKLPIWKRLFDILFSLAAIILLLPLFFIIILAIRLESKGPIIYKSKRVGSNYHIFDFYKFRSMFTDADKHLKDFSSLNQYKEENNTLGIVAIKNNIEQESTSEMNDILLISDDFIIPEQEYISKKSNENKNSFIKLENDPRVTKVGHFIRKYSLDELPQLFNILKGDMSVVGNRPLPLYEAELLTSDEFIDRFMAPAGLTGIWQVEKRGNSGKLSAEERKMLDIKYAKTFSFLLDLKIIFKTFTAFIQKENV